MIVFHFFLKNDNMRETKEAQAQTRRRFELKSGRNMGREENI